jgi:hypothetical protein
LPSLTSTNDRKKYVTFWSLKCKKALFMLEKKAITAAFQVS